jgi:hypothetical protein
VTTRQGDCPPRLALVARRGPAVHSRCRLRLKVDEHGWITARSADDRHGFIDTYAPGATVEIDLGQGVALAGYVAMEIAQAVSQCRDVYLISAKAWGEAPGIDGGVAFNADGCLTLLRAAIGEAASRQSPDTC